MKVTIQQIKNLIGAYNRLNGQDLVLTTVTDQSLEVGKALAYMQQYCADLTAIVLHGEFGFGPDRQKKLCEAYQELEKKFKQMRKDDPKDQWEYESALERGVSEAFGKYYQDREQRYLTTIRMDGREVIGYLHADDMKRWI